MSESYLASKSLAFRANLAKLVSPLRRVRSKTPFFQLQAHRIPTLWSLYRGLLRNSPTEDVKFRIRVLFRQRKGSTGIERTVRDLKMGYKLSQWLEFFKKAKRGDAHCQAVVSRFSSLIAAKREKALMIRLAREEMEWQAKLRHRPILSGGFMRPTLFHGPLPRMKPQPPAISHLISRRIKKRDERRAKVECLEDVLEDVRIEESFEAGLQKLKQPISQNLAEIEKSMALERDRIRQSFSPELLERIFEARREKVRNKTHERERERRGEETKSSLRRKRKGPPAHILAKMTPEQRKMDEISRSLSEAGYVGLVKKRLGFKLKDPELPLELGKKKNRPLLDEATSLIRAENRRRALEARKTIEAQSITKQ
ncbi:hypothetical protein HYPSUDRAFT_61513 [Hypholoma sublateritium FD-334 SS-4]|uniref:Uncharacterized protein n=1 Tax=Hypholoma sublateritium (strain FD-334 SS-4) TaxID=945553 RepID=A0A0D2PFF4_HYPSF|nr:hypothetical protein HYPSUDRAFT_61513 [Hypholoma sublateritium FD-334 SS-4]